MTHITFALISLHMNSVSERGLYILAAGILLGLAVLGYLLKEGVHSFKQYERSVTVRGLAEQEHLADIVIWPIRFTETSNDLEEIYQKLEDRGGKSVRCLEDTDLVGA